MKCFIGIAFALINLDKIKTSISKDDLDI